MNRLILVSFSCLSLLCSAQESSSACKEHSDSISNEEEFCILEPKRIAPTQTELENQVSSVVNSSEPALRLIVVRVAPRKHGCLGLLPSGIRMVQWPSRGMETDGYHLRNTPIGPSDLVYLAW